MMQYSTALTPPTPTVQITGKTALKRGLIVYQEATRVYQKAFKSLDVLQVDSKQSLPVGTIFVVRHTNAGVFPCAHQLPKLNALGNLLGGPAGWGLQICVKDQDNDGVYETAFINRFQNNSFSFVAEPIMAGTRLVEASKEEKRAAKKVNIKVVDIKRTIEIRSFNKKQVVIGYGPDYIRQNKQTIPLDNGIGSATIAGVTLTFSLNEAGKPVVETSGRFEDWPVLTKMDGAITIDTQTVRHAYSNQSYSLEILPRGFIVKCCD